MIANCRAKTGFGPNRRDQTLLAVQNSRVKRTRVGCALTPKKIKTLSISKLETKKPGVPGFFPDTNDTLKPSP